jgi:hypothetical protein
MLKAISFRHLTGRRIMPFVKGQSGNPAGRPPGARNKSTLAVEAQLEARAEQIAGVAIERALMGDTPALRMCMDRILPRERERPLPFALPAIRGAADVERAAADITAAVGAGEITTREALDLIAIVERSFRLVEAAQAQEGRAVQQAVSEGAGASDTSARPASEARDNGQSAKETVRYNGEPTSRAAAPGPNGSEKQTETTKYNGSGHRGEPGGRPDSPVPLASARNLQGLGPMAEWLAVSNPEAGPPLGRRAALLNGAMAWHPPVSAAVHGDRPRP